MKTFFIDRMSVEAQNGKRVISVRDGIQKYYGFEIGKEPQDKVFRVYRSAQTIKNCAPKMLGIPVTDEHVELKDEIPKEYIVGKVLSSEVKEMEIPQTKTTCVIFNDLEVDSNMLSFSSKNQLSLGYFADLIESDSDDYDLEQVDIVPHHLAIVKKARCGDTCKFTDKGADEMDEKLKKQQEQEKKKITDAEGQPDNPQDGEEGKSGDDINLQKIQEILQQLPQAIKQMNIDDLKKIVPVLQEAVNKALENAPELQEQKMQEEEQGEQMPTTDSVDFKDTKEFKDAVIEYGNKRAEIILKAKKFVDGIDFSKMDNLAIMKAVLEKAMPKEKFEDSEVPVAFKLLKKIGQYKDFGKFSDSDAELIEKLKDKEL